VTQEIHAIGTIISRCALVDGFDIDCVLQGAVFNKSTLGNLLIVFGQAHDETKVDLWVRV
jgi:hypothetical protein